MNLPANLDLKDLLQYMTNSGEHPTLVELRQKGADVMLPEIFADFADSRQATFQFPNGYGASVIFGHMFYSNGVDTFEIGLTHENGGVAGLVYDFEPFEDDVLGHQTGEEVIQLLNLIKNHAPIGKKAIGHEQE